MIEKPTVLVLGAGASAEYGFPIGNQLIKDIIEYYKNPAQGKLTALICELDNYKYPSHTNLEYASNENISHPVAFSPIVQPKNSLVDEFVSALLKSHTASIDDFLYHHEKYRLIGKISILLTLIKRERGYQQEIKGWYSYLWKSLYQGTNGIAKELLQNRIKIITFNYERSLEHFLYVALSNMYSLDNPEIAGEILNKVPIYHVYGSLGKLSWQNTDIPICEMGENLDTGVHLGLAQNTPEDKVTVIEKNVFDTCKRILSIAKSIKIYHEDQDMTPKYLELISEAEKIYFLGFGYLEQNIKALGLSRKSTNAHVFGTTLGLGNQEARNVANLIYSFTSKGDSGESKIWYPQLKYNTLDINNYFKEVAPLA